MGIAHHVHNVFEIAFGNVREPFVPVAQDQDMEPLDEQADECDYAIDPQDDADEDSVKDTDEQFKPACIVLVGKELVG
jgi:hypothetical protein